MSEPVKTHTAGRYTATVLENLIVEVRCDGELIDRPGPWGDFEGADGWASLIVGKLNYDKP